MKWAQCNVWRERKTSAGKKKWRVIYGPDAYYNALERARQITEREGWETSMDAGTLLILPEGLAPRKVMRGHS